MVHPTLALSFVALGAVLGAAGQGARAVVGLKKGSDRASKEGKEFREWFDSRRLVLSLIIGAIAGILGAVALSGQLETAAPGDVATRATMLQLVAIGYAGTDFIEGFVRSYLPGSDDESGDLDEPTDGLPGDGDTVDRLAEKVADRLEERIGEGLSESES